MDKEHFLHSIQIHGLNLSIDFNSLLPDAIQNQFAKLFQIDNGHFGLPSQIQSWLGLRKIHGCEDIQGLRQSAKDLYYTFFIGLLFVHVDACLF